MCRPNVLFSKPKIESFYGTIPQRPINGKNASNSNSVICYMLFSSLEIALLLIKKKSIRMTASVYFLII